MSERPNFLIIMSDQHAPDTIGAMGHPAVQTPALDQLMSAGVSFGNAYCCYPMCTPSRASFMTGQLTPEHGVWELGTPLRSDMPTWAHVLRQAGYTTSISGRMHFVGHDRMHGFERRVHADISETLIPSAYGDWDQPQGDDHVMLAALKNAGPTDEPTRAERFDGAVAAAAMEELSLLTSRESDDPWALMVGLYLPHFEYAVSRDYYDRYDDVEIPMPRVPPNGKTYEEMIPTQLENSRKWLGLTTDGASEEQVRMARRCYYGMITCMDEQIGKLVAHLNQVGAADNTWIIYLSDHGDNMGEHGFWSKLNFYEDSVRVPLIVVPPGYGKAGALCQTPVSLVDWMATVLDLTGQESRFEPKPGEQCPAMVLLHGGGGTAFEEWVRLWNARGYAAIVIDQCGCQPQVPAVDGQPHDRNPDGGPPGWDQSVFQINEPLTDQWQYHAIAAAIRAHSLLAHHPDVDAERIGVTGISWGGYLTCLVAAVDERFKCAVPVYGCGFLGENSGWKYGLFPTRPEADIKKWLEDWDPAGFLPHARMPFLWVNGTNDFAYPMDSMQKSYDILGGPHQLCVRIEMPHGHAPGWEPVEIMDFADHLLRGKSPLTEISEFGHDSDSMWAHYESPDPIKEAMVCFTRAESFWGDRRYNQLPALIDHESRRVTAAIPNLSTVCFLNLIDQENRVTSTRHICPD